MLMGRGSDKKANSSIWVGAVMQKLPVKAVRAKEDRQTDQPTNIVGPSPMHATKN